MRVSSLLVAVALSKCSSLSLEFRFLGFVPNRKCESASLQIQWWSGLAIADEGINNKNGVAISRCWL